MHVPIISYKINGTFDNTQLQGWQIHNCTQTKKDVTEYNKELH